MGVCGRGEKGRSVVIAVFGGVGVVRWGEEGDC